MGSDTAADPWAHLTRFTEARIALGRAGDALPTRRVLEYQLAHARARDAVHLPLDVEGLARSLAAHALLRVQSLAPDRAAYLRRPDLGRRLSPDHGLAPGAYDAAIVLADGLSACAVHANGPALVEALLPRLVGWRLAPLVIATQARVALGDAAAEALGAPLVLVLIGERPGLSAADSLGAYLTFAPRAGVTRDAERNCVSNIRGRGLAPDEAARRIAALMVLARHRGLTGVGLKEDEALALAAAPEQPAIAPGP